MVLPSDSGSYKVPEELTNEEDKWSICEAQQELNWRSKRGGGLFSGEYGNSYTVHTCTYVTLLTEHLKLFSYQLTDKCCMAVRREFNRYLYWSKASVPMYIYNII